MAARTPAASRDPLPAAARFAVRGRQLPALDGLRAFAVAGVVAYHLGLGWASGGYLGVDLFFVLSGFLITGLLVEEHAATRAVALGAFWVRRARRLLPALLVLIAALAAATAVGLVGGLIDPSILRGDALATVFYVANWHQLLAHQSYFARFGAPSPLQHTWSLAIEEQFYVLWPPVLALALWISARRSPGRSAPGRSAPGRSAPGRSASGRSARGADPDPASVSTGARRQLSAVTAGLALVSATWMAWLSLHGVSLDRLYYGTDTRAFDLLAGATVALWVAGGGGRGVSRERGLLARLGGALRPYPRSAPEVAPPWARPVAAAAAATLLALLWTRGGAGSGSGPPVWMFRGGFALAALCGAVLVAAVRNGGSDPVVAVLSLRPLRYVGRISYGLYLWHWPVISQMTAARTGLDGLELDLARLATIAGLAVASHHLVEQPLRRAHLGHWPTSARVVLAPAAMGATALIMVLSTLPVSLAQATVISGVGGPATAGPVAGAGSAPSSPQDTPPGFLPGEGGAVGSLVPIGRTPSPSSPLRVTLVGDSVMHSAAPALAAAIDATGAATVHDASFPGWGLSTDTGWSTTLRDHLRDEQPQVVVASWSWDDDWLLSDPSAYRSTLERFVTMLLAPPSGSGGGGVGASAVVFTEFPPLGPQPWSSPAHEARQASGVAAWNALARSLAGLFPGHVLYLPVGASVELRGRFATWLAPLGEPAAPDAKWVRVRMVDNTHFCPAGAARYAAAVLADLREVTALPGPAPGWWTGSWTRDVLLYDVPAGSCPADHPA